MTRNQFYGAIETTAAAISDFHEKQGFLNTVYENFFQGFDEKTADTHGIVDTSQSIARHRSETGSEEEAPADLRSRDHDGSNAAW